MLNSLDTARLSTLLLIAMILLVIAAIVIVRFVGQATKRVVWLAVVCLMILGSYAFRSELGACSATCDCRVLARDIEVPTCVAGRTQTSDPNRSNNGEGGDDTGGGGSGDGGATQTVRTGQPSESNDNNPVVIDGANETVRPGP